MFYSLMAYTMTYCHSGLELGPIKKDMMGFMEILEDYHQSYFLAMYRTQVQFVLNLTDQSADPTILTGAVMDQDEYLTKWSNTQNPLPLDLLCLNRVFLAYLFDDLHLASEMASKLSSPFKAGRKFMLAPRLLFEGLVAFGLARATGGRRRRYQRQGKKILHRLEQFVRDGSVNCCHMMLLLRAELASLTCSKDTKKVRFAYDEAIAAAGRLGFTNHQAVGNERAGVYFLEQKHDRDWASTYLTRACELFDQWGANAKVKQMEEKYSDLVVRSMESEGKSRSGAVSARAHFDEITKDISLRSAEISL
jgi:histidine kinase